MSLSIEREIKDYLASSTEIDELAANMHNLNFDRNRNYDYLRIVHTPVLAVQQKPQRSNEDRFVTRAIGRFWFCAVFDGHGGSHQMGPNHVADFCVNHLPDLLGIYLNQTDTRLPDMVKYNIIEAFIEFDRLMHQEGLAFGSTCSAVLIDRDLNLLYQINLGDSRSIIFNDNMILTSTKDHCPMDPEELDRIINAGGRVENGRVNGSLLTSRAFGDFDLKINNGYYDPVAGMVCAVPDIQIIPLDYVKHIILTSDAPFERNIFNDRTLVDLFSRLSNYISDKEKILAVMAEIIAKRTNDDITLIYLTI